MILGAEKVIFVQIWVESPRIQMAFEGVEPCDRFHVRYDKYENRKANLLVKSPSIST